MEIGWIDFSKEDREKVYDVLNLLQEQGALDELGIGQIRDAFANRFFPGTSTVQTRAKYFLLVPYILREATTGSYGGQLKSVLARIDQEEKECALYLYNRCRERGISPIGIGIIGARVLPDRWVARKPSNIYWNGIQAYGICSHRGISIPDLIRSSLYPEEQKLKNIEDKVLVIFGGTSGIGESIFEMAKEYGAKVYACSDKTGVDVTSYDDIEGFLKKVSDETGKIDYVINTAGVLKIGKLLDRDIDDIKQEIDINYTGSINVAKASIPYLKETKGCMLMFTSSSYTRGRAMYSTYSSAKAAIVNLVQALSEELYADGIRINSINPERTATQMRFNAFGKEPADTLLKAEKVAEASLKTLLSDLTGQVIDVRRD